MKHIVSGTVAAFVLGAAIASSQTPPASQAPTPAPAPAQPPATQAQPAQPGEQRAAAPKTQNTTYRGILKGSAAGGWTLSPVRSTSGTAGATATSGADATYSIVAAEGSKVDLTPMANQCVEVAGVLAPESAKPAAGDAKASATRTFTVSTIKAAEGCK